MTAYILNLQGKQIHERCLRNTVTVTNPAPLNRVVDIFQIANNFSIMKLTYDRQSRILFDRLVSFGASQFRLWELERNRCTKRASLPSDV